jgi:hypothetical protein
MAGQSTLCTFVTRARPPSSIACQAPIAPSTVTESSGLSDPPQDLDDPFSSTTRLKPPPLPPPLLAVLKRREISLERDGTIIICQISTQRRYIMYGRTGASVLRKTGPGSASIALKLILRYTNLPEVLDKLLDLFVASIRCQINRHGWHMPKSNRRPSTGQKLLERIILRSVES